MIERGSVRSLLHFYSSRVFEGVKKVVYRIFHMRYDVASILPSLNRGTQRLFSVKYLFGEANIA